MIRHYDHEWSLMDCPRCIPWATGKPDPACIRCGGAGKFYVRQVNGMIAIRKVANGQAIDMGAGRVRAEGWAGI